MPDTDALITAHRPPSFDKVVGQAALVRSLRESIAMRTAQSYLLSGPSGTGKTTLARIIASELGCRSPVELDAATNTGIDDMRVVTEALKYRPIFEDDVSVFIIDECHALSAQAWKSLLKSIEEPPTWVYFILCTTEPSKVPDTIRTRCFSGQLKSVGRDELFDLLDYICREEAFNTPTDVLETCVKEAGGSPRQAIANLAVCLNCRDGQDAATLLQSALHSAEAIDLIKALLAGQTWERLQPILVKLGDLNAESVRQAIRAYLTKIILNTTDSEKAFKLVRILDNFSTPFYGNDGITPIVMAVGKVLFTE